MTPCLTTDNMEPRGENDIKDKRSNYEENFTESF